MARVKKQETITKKQCIKCQNIKLIEKDFYISYSKLHGDGRVPVCKSCLSDMFDTQYDESNAHEAIKNIMKMIDKPFISHLVDSSRESVASGTNRYMGLFATYMKNVVMRQYVGMTFADSIFESPTKVTELIQESNPKSKPTSTFDLEELKEKYGYGYPDEEYILFEKKYQQLRSSFQLVTTMHEEYFREYCINKVKETLAKSKGLFKEAKEWAAMVKDVADAGKLKPSQMSKADLSGGLDTFGQLARMVEENFEIMPLLPKFTDQPKDKPDVVLWCFINYVRDLKGLPACEYKEIYEFYNKRKQEYESQMSDSLSSDADEEDVDG